MPSFALITEGITDQAVLENILCGLYGKNTPVIPLLPLRDATDESRVAPNTFSNWELVLEFCTRHDRILEALRFNDFIIIQIDTDCGDHANFGVSLTEGGAPRPVPELVDAVKAKLVSRLSPELYEAHKDKIFFAICVHSLECWLLPLHATQDKKKRKLVNCAKALSDTLTQSRLEYSKDHRTYTKLSREYGRRGRILDLFQFNESFALFINSLPNMAPRDD